MVVKSDPYIFWNGPLIAINQTSGPCFGVDLTEVKKTKTKKRPEIKRARDGRIYKSPFGGGLYIKI